MPEQESDSRCSYKEPFMILGDGAQAPVLDYDIPQKSAFSLYGRLRQPVPIQAFRDFTRKEPPGSWWRTFADMKPEEIKERLQDFAGKGYNIQGLITGGDRALSASPRRLRSLERETPDSRIETSRNWDEKLLKKVIAAGLMPLMQERLSGKLDIRFLPRPKPRPTLYIIEEYRVASFLGNYGAGKTVKTFSLLPGEKTTISIKTFRDSTVTRSQSENILDSFSESSADEFEERLQQEQGAEFQRSSEHTFSLGTGMNLSVALSAVDIGGSLSTEGQSSISTTRASHVSTISNTLNKHVQSTNTQREIEIETSVSETVASGMERSTVRELENINHSRVLNFVFRQLLQEYITLTYLKDIKLVFTNGFPESVVMADIPRIRDLLSLVLKPGFVDKAEAAILKHYCAVFNYRDDRKSLIEEVTEDFGECPYAGRNETITYLRRSRDLTDEYESITVPGVILKADRNVIRTDSVIADALLGQGEALDCYNARLQEAAAEEVRLKNVKTDLGLEIVQDGGSVGEKADAFKTIFKEEPYACCCTHSRTDTGEE